MNNKVIHREMRVPNLWKKSQRELLALALVASAAAVIAYRHFSLADLGRNGSFSLPLPNARASVRRAFAPGT